VAIAGGRRFVARTDQFILSRIDARNGALGIVPANLDGAVVTNDFPLFEVSSSRLGPAFLGWWIRTHDFVELCQRASEGTTNRVRLQEERFLALEILLPSLAEQRQIVARIEALASRIAEARSLRNQADDEAKAVQSRSSSAIFEDSRRKSQPLGPLLAEPPRNGLSPKQELEVGGRPMLRINAVSSSPTRFVDHSVIKRVQVSSEEAEPFVLQNDDVFIVRYNGDSNRVAKAAIFKGQTNFVFPDKLLRLRPRPDQMIPDFLVYALGCRRVRGQIEKLVKTTAGQIGVSGRDAKSFVVPVPSLPEQRPS